LRTQGRGSAYHTVFVGGVLGGYTGELAGGCSVVRLLPTLQRPLANLPPLDLPVMAPGAHARVYGMPWGLPPITERGQLTPQPLRR